MKLLFVTPLIIFLVILMLMLAKMLNPDNKTSPTLIGQTLPEFSLPATSKGLADLKNSDINGKYSLLNIFGSWCISCKIEHPFLMQLKKKNAIPIYGIAWKDQPEKLAKYLIENGNPYLAIGNDIAGKVIIELGVSGAPETLLISPDGTIKFRYAGPLSEEIWYNKFLPIIERSK